MTFPLEAQSIVDRITALENAPNMGGGGGPVTGTLPFVVLSPSGGDDAPIINAALAAHKFVWLTPGVFDIGAKIVLGQNGRLMGSGKYLTKLRKTAGVDAVQCSYGCMISDLGIDGNNLGGRGFVFSANDHYQQLDNVSAWTDGYAVDFEADGAGTNALINNLSANRYSLTNYAVRFPNNDLAIGVGSGNRQLRRFISSGGYGVDLGGSNNTLVEDGNFVNLLMNGNARSCRILNNRIAGSQRTPIVGIGHYIEGNFVSGGWLLTGGVTDCNVRQVRQSGVTPAVLNDGSAGAGNIVWASP